MAKKFLCLCSFVPYVAKKKALCRTWEGNIDTVFNVLDIFWSVAAKKSVYTVGNERLKKVGIAQPRKLIKTFYLYLFVPEKLGLFDAWEQSAPHDKRHDWQH